MSLFLHYRCYRCITGVLQVYYRCPTGVLQVSWSFTCFVSGLFLSHFAPNQSLERYWGFPHLQIYDWLVKRR